MIFPTTSIVALVALFVTPILAAPIHVRDVMGSHSLASGLEKRSMFFGHAHPHDQATLVARDLPEYSDLVARDESPILETRSFDDWELEARSLDDWELEARSFDDMEEAPLAKRDEGEPMRLVRRKSIFTKMKEGFKKAGSAIKKGFQKAGAAIKKGVQKAATAVKKGVQKVASTVKKGVQKAASAVKKGVQKVASTVKKGVQKAASAVKKGFQKVGQGIKKAAQKVGHFVKTTGAKIAKFGLKVYATATKLASHVVGFIPGVGKPLGKALGAVSKVADFASSKIHANLGSKLEKGMKVMDKIQHPFSGAAGKVFDAVLKRDFEDEHLYERDLLEGEELFERDEAALEARSLDDGEFLEARSFEDGEALEARSFDDMAELEARSWAFEDDEA